MNKLINTFFKIDNKFIRFILVGILNTGFGVGMYCLLVFLSVPYWWATLISTILGVLFNFKTIGILVFENRDNSLIFRFILCYTLAYILNIGILYVFIEHIGLNGYWGGILATPFVATFSFLFQKMFVYRKQKKYKFYNEEN